MAKILLYIAAPYNLLLAGITTRTFLATGLFGYVCLALLPRLLQPKEINVPLRWTAWFVSLIIMLWQSFPNGITSIKYQDTTYRVTANKLNVRAEANKTAKVLFQLRNNNKVVPITQGEDWIKISTDEGEGYVASQYIVKVKEGPWVFLFFSWLFLGACAIKAMLRVVKEDDEGKD